MNEVKYPLIKIEIPDETKEVILKDKSSKKAIGKIVDVITGMQETIDTHIGESRKK